MNILKNYKIKVANIMFGNYITSIPKKPYLYAFRIPEDMELNVGDYVVVDCAQGLQVGVYVSPMKYEKLPKRIRDNNYLKNIVAKVGDYNVNNYRT